jgi:putative nucleotidyltransferase with HDIG domain
MQGLQVWGMQTVLLTDGGKNGVRLRRDLSLALPCKLVSAEGSAPDDIRDAALIVSDLSLNNPIYVRLLKDRLDRYRGAATPVLWILPEITHHAVCQANAIGATATLPANASRERLLRTLTELLGASRHTDESPTTAVARRSAMQAGISLACILDAAEKGASISPDALNQGSDLILHAVESAQVRTWLDVVWGYDDATYQHCLIVAGLAASFAQHLGFALEDRQRLVKGALLHDIGKAKIPLEVLNKPGRLSADEFEIMRTHPAVGHQFLVAQGGFSDEQLSVVRHHHEYLDGSGYPDGLRGNEIIDLVRLTTICDIYGALVERRPYRPPLAPDVAFATMEKMGDKLDATLVAAFRKVMIDCLN